MQDSENKSVLLLTTSDRPREYTADIKVNLEQDLNVNVDIINLDDLEFYVNDNQVEIIYDVKNIDEVSLCYIKHWHTQDEVALVVSSYFETKSKPAIPSEVKGIIPKTKFGETFFMALNNLPVPDSVFYPITTNFLSKYEELVKRIGLPFVFKAIDGKKGTNNYLIDGIEALEDVVTNGGDHQYIAQSFIDNDGDYRIINFGSELKLAIYRTRSGDTHLNNTSQGGDGQLVELSDLGQELKDDSLRAALLLGREVSGIDVVVEKNTKKHYIFEINYSPQITTGTYLSEKRKYLSEYVKELLRD